MSTVYKLRAGEQRPCDKVETRDEYYTPDGVVEYICEPIKEYLKDKVVLCPWDSEASAFTVVLQKYCKKVIWNTWGDTSEQNKENIPTEWDISISNPPFSMKQQCYKLLGHKPMIGIGQVLFITNKYWGNLINIGEIKLYSTLYGDYANIKRWITQDKENMAGTPMGICIGTNLPDDLVKKHQQYYLSKMNEMEIVLHEQTKKVKDLETFNRYREYFKKKEKELLERAINAPSPFSDKVKKALCKIDRTRFNDKNYNNRHFVYIPSQIGELYKLGKDTGRYDSLSKIVADYIRKNTY